MSDTDWQVIFESGHWNHSGWSRDSRDGALVCSCGAVLRETASTALAGPLRPVRYADGRTEWHDLPRNTLDIRYAACGNHHLACDCREALLAEDINEYRMMFRQLERAILNAIKGHQTYAYTGPSDAGWTGEDEFAMCKCQACAIARAAHIGFSECMRQRHVASGRLADEARERDRAYFAATYPDMDEVPF